MEEESPALKGDLYGWFTGQLTDGDYAGHAFRKSAAGAFGPDLAKKLSQLVKMEKNVMRSMELVGRERMEVAVCVNADFVPGIVKILHANSVLRGYSNNFPSGVRTVMRMSPT